LVERVPPARARRPLLGSLHLAELPAHEAGDGALPHQFVLSSIKSKGLSDRLRSCARPSRVNRRGASAPVCDDCASFPAVQQRGGRCLVSCRCSGGQRDRTLPNPQDNRHGATAAER
jgi:hypothetical protein